MVRHAARVAVLAVLLVGCAGELGTPGEALRFLSSGLDPAPVNEPYRAPLHAVGGLRPYEFTLEEGTLPPGIDLVNGVLQGVPTSLGDYRFTVAVSDANLSSTFEEYQLSVIEPPPPSLSFSAPQTEVRGAVTLRGRASDARSLAGLSTLVTWDAERFALVEGSVVASSPSVAVFSRAEPGQLQVDVAALGNAIDGSAELFRFQLEPVAGAWVLSLSGVTRFASRRGDELLFETGIVTEGGTPAASDPGPETPAPPDEDPVL